LEYLLAEGIDARAAAMTDPGVMPKEERKTLIERLNGIDPRAGYSSTLEEEQIDRYETTLQRLKAFADPEFARKLERVIEEGIE
jgi:hypothetical protein